MGRSQESYHKKEVRKNKEKKRLEKEKKKAARKEGGKSSGLDDMIAYVDAHGNITSEPPDPVDKEEIAAEDIEVSIPKADPSQKEDPIHTGTVSYFNDSKGYGFIRDDRNRESVFVHVNNLIDDVREGSKVTFEVEPGQRGPAAVRVKLAK